MARKKTSLTIEMTNDLAIVKEFLDENNAEERVQRAHDSIEVRIRKLNSLENENKSYKEMLQKAWKIIPSSEKNKVSKPKKDPDAEFIGPKPKHKGLKGSKKNKSVNLRVYEKRRAEEKRQLALDEANLFAQENGSMDTNTRKISEPSLIPVARAVNSELEPRQEYRERMDAYGESDDDNVDPITEAFEQSDDINEQAFLQRVEDVVVRTVCSFHRVEYSSGLPSAGNEDFASIEEEVHAIFRNPIEAKESAIAVRLKEEHSERSIEIAEIVPYQQLFDHDVTEMTEETADLKLDPAQKTTAIRTSFEEASRFDVRVSVKKIKCRKEIAVDQEGNRITPAIENCLGPRNTRYTWNTLITLATLVVKFVFPLSRVAKLLSSVSMQFSRSTIWNMLAYVGETLLPAYIGLIEESAYHGVQFHADDTDAVTRTTHREAKENGHVNETDNSAILERNLGKQSVERVRAILPYRSKKADGKTEKEKLHLSVVIGRTNLQSPDSWFFVYYSHIGSVGNILARYLKLRKIKIDELDAKIAHDDVSLFMKDSAKKELEKIPKAITIIRDQSTQNIPKIPESYGFTIKTSGCLMHARRKFRHPTGHEEIVSPMAQWCELMICYVYRVEYWCTLAGRTVERVRRLRERYSRALLDAVESFSLSMVDDEPISRYRNAAEHFVKHKKDFFAHLDDPYVAPDSGLPERAIRTKKLFARSSFGHETKRGTLCYDIIRSIMATCIACRISFSAYFKWVAIQREQFGDEEFRKMDPMQLTPQTFKKSMINPKQ